MLSELFAESAQAFDLTVTVAHGGFIVRYRCDGVYEGEPCVEVRASVFTDSDTAAGLVHRLMKQYEGETDEPLNEKEIKKARKQ